MDNTYKLFMVSFVKTPDIKSQWQAHFIQIFPIGYDKLPLKHTSDKEFFDTNWQGDSYTTYKQFMAEYCKGWIKV